MTREERKEYMKKYYTEHREELKEYKRKHYYEHKEEKKLNLEEHRKYRRKYRAEHSEQERERNRKRRAENLELYRERLRKRKAKDLNMNGVTKNYIRKTSREILKRCHTKLQGYEIHHCFGYEDPNKFVYIPKHLHNKIHRFLWDNGIPADTDHWMAIRELINDCEEYTYIRA